MAQFVLTAQLQLQAPRNASKVVNQIQNQLKGVQIPVTVKSAAQATKQINQVTAATNKAASAAEAMGRSFGLAIKRFAAFTVASRAVSLFTNSLANAVDEAIDFQREVVKIAQVTGKTVKELKGLEQTITRLSVTLGTSSKELLSTARILSQAGIKAGDLRVAIEALAKTTLAPTFEDINKTAEGAVAILAQFEGGVGRLEKQLGAINAVAGQFAVESGDLISAVRRFGGVFKSAGGELEELLALFTSVRATTRESSESIATGLRTIFTRIQRPRTIAFLKQFGVELLDVNGKFVGPLKAVEQLNKAFADLPQGDVRFIRIAEELGGFRQIGKVIPLIQQFEMAERARQAAIDGGNSLTKDTATAQQALAVQITKVKEEFLALVRGIANSNSFQIFTRTALSLASALIKIADALKPLIPLLGAFAAFKFAKGLGGFGAGIGSAVKGLGRNQGGAIQKFARGGYVPGSGNRDTVPAMLTPGEFVIKKSSAQKLGAGTLQQMNENRFAGGGFVENYKKVGVIGFVPGENGIIDADGRTTPGSASSTKKQKSSVDVIGSLVANTNLEGDQSGLAKLFAATGSKKVNQLPETLKGKYGTAKNWGQAAEALVKQLGFGSFTSGTKGISTDGFGRTIPDPEKSETTLEQDIIDTTTKSIGKAIGTVGRRLAKAVGIKNVRTKKAPQTIIDQIGIDSIAGKIFEGGISVIDGKPFDEKTSGNLAPFDFPGGIGAAKGEIESLDTLKDKPTDAKKTVSPTIVKDVATKKINNAIAQDILNSKVFQSFKKQYESRKQLNKGGGIGGSGDTVPALLTPGEFVVNKQAAQSIGYGNLNSMNKSGVARFNKGGAVQTFQAGGSVSGGGGGLSVALIGITTALAAASSAVSKFGDKTDKASDKSAAITIGLEKLISGLTAAIGGIIVAFQADKFGKAIQEGRKTIENATSGLGGSLSEAGSDLTDTAGKAGKEKAQAQKDESGLTKNKAGTTAAGEVEGQAFSTAKSRKADARKALIFEEKRVRAIEAQIPIKQQQLDNSKLEENIQKETIANLEKNKKLTEESIAGRDSDVEQAELEATTAQKNTLLAQEEQSVAKRKVDKADEGLTKISEKGVRNQRDIDIKKREIDFIEQNQSGGEASTQDEAKIKSLRSEIQNLEQDNEKLRKGYVDLSGRKGEYNRELKETEKVTRKAEIAEDKKNQELKNTKTAADNARRQVDRYGEDIKSAGRDAAKAAEKTEKAERKLTNARKASTQAAKQAAQARKKFVREQRKNDARRIGGGAIRAGGVGLGIATAVIGVGQQIAAGFAEFFRRQERIAIASEDSAKAISAAGSAAQSENYGRAFSAEGMIAGFQSTFLGDNSGVDRLAKDMADNIARSRAEAGFQVAQSTVVTDRRRLKEGKFTTGEGANAQVDFAKAGSRTIAAQNRARAEFGALSPAEREKKEAEFAASGTQLITDFANSGASLAELERTANGLAGLNQDQRKQYQILIKTLVAAREAQKAVNKANFDSLKITSAFGAAAAAVNNFTAGLETGSNTLAGYVSELEAAQQGIGIDASGAIDAIEQELVASAQGAGAGSLVSSLQGQANVARATNQFGVGAAGALEGLNLSTDTETAKQQLEAALISAIPKDADDSTKKKLKQQIEAQVSGIENIQTADLSAVVKGVVDAGGKLSAGFQQAAKLQAQHNQVMIGLYKKQEELEGKAAEAKNKAIDSQLEAAKIFEDFGGSKLTGGAKLGARVAQFNNVGGLGGLGAQLTSGSAGDIRQAQGKINQTFFDQTDQFKVNAAARSVAGGGPGAFAGAQGIRDDKREEAKKANAALITFTKQRIQLLKEELSIVQKKNAEEKSALDKLISGDVEGFLEGQAAAGAGAALRSGDASLAGLFGTSALGAGFKSLEGQGLSDQQLRSAEDLTLQRFGIQSTGVLSGTTSEEQALNSQGRELAGIFGDLAGDQAAFAQAEFTVQEAVINATNATFSNKLREVAEQNKNTKGGQSNVAGFFRGGPVYANRGMFVPRGTDTVPAMLTPGEFVVNRSSVQRGNNLQILRAMNSGGGASGQSKMRGGGVVRYYQDGGSVAPAISPEGITQLQGVFTQFAESVDKLVNSQFSVKLDTTNVNVNFNGASFLSTLKDDIKSELLETVKAEIGKAKPNNSGDIKTGNTVLGN